MTASLAESGLAFEAVFNFRDFGGQPTRTGGAVRRGRLFRSAHLARASNADHERLHALGVAVVVDLRRPSERRAEPTKWPRERAPRTIMSLQGEGDEVPLHLQFLRDAAEVTPAGARDYMLATYRRLPFDERHIEVFRAAFRALEAGEAPMLVHCAAGKDRTGLFCALVLESLGAAKADILADYEATNRAAHFEAVLHQAAARFTHKLGRRLTPEAIRPMVGVDAAYLESAYSAIADEIGGVDAYLAHVLGVDGPARRRLAAVLVEDAP